MTETRAQHTEFALSIGDPQGTATTVRDGLFNTALEVLDVLGAKSFSLRSIASFAHYSASAVSYHAKPFNEFCDELWRRIAADLIRTGGAEHSWRADDAERIRTWTLAFPGRADWFLSYLPDEPFAPGGRTRSRAERSLARFRARRLQAALELTMSNGDRDMSARELAEAIAEFGGRNAS